MNQLSALCLGFAAIACSSSASPAIAGALGSAASTNYVWHSVTVGGGGFSPNILFSPVEAGLAYLRTDIGGIYRWNAPTQRWVPLQDGMPEGNYFGVESLAPDPLDANVVYAAVGMYRSGPAAMLRSDDRGASWHIYPISVAMGGNESGRGLGERLAVDPGDTSIVYFGSRQDGLQRSTDRGASWSRVASFPVPAFAPAVSSEPRAGISFVLFDTGARGSGSPTRTIFVGVAEGPSPHLYRTDDAGASWQAVANQPSEWLPVRAQLDAEGMLYIAYCDGLGPNGITGGAVYKLNIHTGAWKDITPLVNGARAAGGFMGLALSVQRPGTVLVSTVDRWKERDTIWQSSDGGEHWRSLRERSDIDARATPFLNWGENHADFGWWIAGLAIDPYDAGHVAYTTGATVYATSALPDTVGGQRALWTPWTQGIEETAILALVSPAQGPPLLSGFGDIGGFVHEDLRTSPATLYTHPTFNDTETLDAAGIAPAVVVRSGRARRTDASLAWSEDFGRSWKPLRAPLADPAVLAASADGASFLAMGATAWLTRDRGERWVAVRGLPAHTRAVADRVDPSRFYALEFASSRLWGSTDGGTSFAPLHSTGLPPGLAREEPRRAQSPFPLLATPDRRADLWLVSRAGLFHSLDAGRHFARVDCGLRVAALAFGKAPMEHGYPTLYAIGSRAGLTAIWRSDDAGKHWSRINDGAHEYGRRFRVIAGDPRVFGRVYVGTDGRGIIYGEPQP